MLRCVDRTVLKRFVVFVFDPIRLAELVSEKRSEVFDLDAVLSCRLAAPSFSRDRIGREVRARASEQIGKFDPERERAFVNERERKILLSRFVRFVLVNGDLRFLRQLFDRHFLDLAHLPDTLSHFHQFVRYGFHVFQHSFFRGTVKKTHPSQR